MTFSTGCLSPNFDRNQKFQGTVTHRTLGLHMPGNPRSGPRLSTLLAGVAASVRAEGDANRKKWRRATQVCSLGPREREKELSMRTRKSVLLAKRLHERAVAHTVKAEKGDLWASEGRSMTYQFIKDETKGEGE